MTDDATLDEIEKNINEVMDLIKKANVWAALTLTRKQLIAVRYILKLHVGNSLATEIRLAQKDPKYNAEEGLDYATSAVDAYHILDEPFMRAELQMTSHGTDACTVYVTVHNVAAIIRKLAFKLPSLDTVTQHYELGDELKKEYEAMFSLLPQVMEIFKAANKLALAPYLEKSQKAAEGETPEEKKTDEYSKLLGSLKKGSVLN